MTLPQAMIHVLRGTIHLHPPPAVFINFNRLKERLKAQRQLLPVFPISRAPVLGPLRGNQQGPAGEGKGRVRDKNDPWDPLVICRCASRGFPPKIVPAISSHRRHRGLAGTEALPPPNQPPPRPPPPPPV